VGERAASQLGARQIIDTARKSFIAYSMTSCAGTDEPIETIRVLNLAHEPFWPPGIRPQIFQNQVFDT
jgi:hypothetical protein